MKSYNIQPMLNVYPDSLGGKLAGTVKFLRDSRVKGAFQALYLLPSLYHSDLDRGFSVIDYGLNQSLAQQDDLDQLASLGIKTKLDFILNHASVLSPQFQSILDKGSQSPYYEFFIDWNQFWQGHGQMTDQGYIQPDPDLIKDMFFRKPGLPILQVKAKTGEELTFWNTFYQEITYPPMTVQSWMKALNCQYTQAQFIHQAVDNHLQAEADLEDLDLGQLQAYKDQVIDYLKTHANYLGQMDLNLQSDLVWDFYRQTLDQLAAYGASIVRLDAFAYGPKEVGKRNFLNEPDTWDLLDKINQMAKERDLELLPEIHEAYQVKIHEKIAQEGYLTYDFFLPGLVLATIEQADAKYLLHWLEDIKDQQIPTVNMLGCHDGIPLLDLKGLLPEADIQLLIDQIVGRGGYVKDLHGQKNVYYQVNATYYSALGEDDDKMRLARALQLFMPGKPQIWYLDLFVGRNDHEAVKRAGAGGHKEINRTNLDDESIENGLTQKVVLDQLDLLRFRSQFPAFDAQAEIQAQETDQCLSITWRYQDYRAQLSVDLKDPSSLCVQGFNPQGQSVYQFGKHIS